MNSVSLAQVSGALSNCGHDHLDALDPSHIPTTAPTALSSTPEYESMSPPQSSGISPPIVEPIKILIQMDDRMRQRTTRFTMQTVARYCRFADRKAGGKEALIMLEGHLASKARREANVK